MKINPNSTIVLVLAALILGVAGCSARGTAPPIIEIVGPTPPRVNGNTLRIATANLWGVSVFGLDWADDINERFAAMARRLAINEAKLDVVLIQEAWKNTARRALLDDPGVARHFPNRVDIVDQPGGAGLVILSRFPIVSAHFKRFEAQGRCIKFWEGDCLSGKGILVVRLEAGDGSIWIGDTHLIACYSRSDESETACGTKDPNGNDRRRQIIEARRTIEALAGNDPALLGGDFNLTRTSGYYPLMTSTAIPTDADAEIDAPSTIAKTVSARGWTEPGEPVLEPNRLDYLWTRSGTKLRWRVLDKVRPIFTRPVVLRSGKSVALSDHPILVTEVCLTIADEPANQCLPLRPDSGGPTAP
jgi:endonuclease/exonuclease/phosphatase family metal-dependent hydrolase